MARGAKRARALVAWALVTSAMCLGNADAQTSRTAAQAERDRRAEAARAEHLRDQANAARSDVRQLDARLAAAELRRSEAETAAAGAEERLALLQVEIGAQMDRRNRAQNALESALIAAAFTERRIEPRAVRAGIFARAAAPSFARDHRAAAAFISQARAQEAAIAEERLILAEAQAVIEAERTQIADLRARRRAAQTQLANDATAAERRVRTLAAEARTLRDLAQRVQRASATPRASDGTVGSAIPASWLAPTQGSITRGFGARTGEGPASQGVMLRTRSGAIVVAPASGEVAYAGVFRSYGQVLILNLDGGYALVLTGLETIQARVGDTVRAGQIVGEMPSSDTTAPDLYVEVRRGDQVVDPGRWLSARGLTADRSVRAG